MSRSSQHVVGIHYAVGNKIGEGSFGVIFEGENILNNGYGGREDEFGKRTAEPVAIKFEPRRSDAPQLRDEFRAYRILNNCRGIPHAYYFGQEGMHNVLILDLLGPSLEDLFEWCGRRFSIKTTCLVAKQMIDRVRTIHEHDLIYRDIKPDNFLISEFQRTLPDQQVIKSVALSANGDPNLIYMVDFGMAKQYRDPRTKQHIPYRERKSLSGTARYMSINTHFGREQSRRDDLESLGHVFFYFLRGSLPWQGLKALNNKLKYEKIGLTKQKLNPDELLMDSIPPQFSAYLKYARALRFEEEPDYDYLISLMDDVLHCMGMEDDGHYDWMDLNNGQGWNIKVNKRANLHGYGNAAPKHDHQNANAYSSGEINPNSNSINPNDTANNNRPGANNGVTAYGNNPRSRPHSNHRNSLTYARQKLKLTNSSSTVGVNPTSQQPNRNRTYDSMGSRVLKSQPGGLYNDYRSSSANAEDPHAVYYQRQMMQRQPRPHQQRLQRAPGDEEEYDDRGFCSKVCCGWC
ncbi:related to Casein kinase I homolog 3 [Zygosaccharomyces bailii]|nr:related to Casein kinase I homolog 3 [Zygosaccharomyces bailii]